MLGSGGVLQRLLRSGLGRLLALLSWRPVPRRAWLAGTLVALVVVLLAEIALVTTVLHSARSALLAQAATERDALLAHTQQVLSGVQPDQAPLVQKTLLLLRDAHKLDAIHLLDAQRQVVAAPHVPSDQWGQVASSFLVESDHLRSARTLGKLVIRQVVVLGEPIERLVLPLGGPWQGRYLCIDRRDQLSQVQSAWQRPLMVGLSLALAMTVVVWVVGLWLMRQTQRTEQRLLQLQGVSRLGQMAATLAHEIRNPLGVISASVDLLRRELGPAHAGQEHVVVMQEEIARIDEQVEQALDLTRELPLRLEPTALSALVHDACRGLQSRAEAQGVRLEPLQVQDCAGSVVLQADPRRLRQALVNHLLNALEAQPQGGCIGLTLRYQQGCLELKITDQGPGFPRSILQSGGEPFLTTKPGGTGLGLHVARRMIERHGGRLLLRNTAQGAEVCWRLPVEPKLC